jgi:hypothetical protein
MPLPKITPATLAADRRGEAAQLADDARAAIEPCDRRYLAMFAGIAAAKAGVPAEDNPLADLAALKDEWSTGHRLGLNALLPRASVHPIARRPGWLKPGCTHAAHAAGADL